MLFDIVFSKPKWQGKDDFLSYTNIIWKNEINKWLLFIQKKNQLERYIPRLNNCTKAIRDEALAEMFSAYILEVKYKYPVIGWEEKTIDNRDVDFIIQDGSDKIYCEVKSPGWESELEQSERLGGRKDQPKYINAEWHSVAPWQAIRHSLKKSYPKFISDCKNLLIIKDDLFISPLEFPSDENIDIALFEDMGIYGCEKGFFVDNSYENIGGVLFLHCLCINGKFEYRHKFVDNKNCRVPFSLDI